MKKHLFLTGEIQIGKSTALKRFFDISHVRADGFLTSFASRGEERELYIYRFDTLDGESEGWLAVKIDSRGANIVPEAFNVYGADIIRASGRHGMIIMDELGVFEECAPEFKAAVFEKLDGDTPVLGVVKKREAPFLDAVRAHPNVEVVEVTSENRDMIPELLLKRFLK